VETVFKYWGLDWTAMSLSLLGVFLLGNKRRLGFIIIAGANIIWVVLGSFLMGSAGIAIGNVVFLIMNIRGYFRWKRA
jgi:hypothetical protein